MNCFGSKRSFGNDKKITTNPKQNQQRTYEVWFHLKAKVSLVPVAVLAFLANSVSVYSHPFFRTILMVVFTGQNVSHMSGASSVRPESMMSQKVDMSR